jgi:hypothetical protein
MRTVPEYDAFGREIGEDPLTAFRAPAKPETAPAAPPAKPEAAAAAPAAKPEANPEPVAVEAAAPPQRLEFVRPPRRRRRGGVASLLVVVAIVAGIGLVGNATVEQGNDVIKRITPDVVTPPAGLQAPSLIRQDNFAAALKTMSDAGLGRPASIRVAPERIDATLVKGGRFHQVQITPGGELREIGTGSAPPRPAVAYAAIDPAAPERLTRAGATRRQPARSIGYVLLMPGRPVTWGAYYKRGRIVIGDAHGRLQRVL